MLLVYMCEEEYEYIYTYTMWIFLLYKCMAVTICTNNIF